MSGTARADTRGLSAGGATSRTAGELGVTSITAGPEETSKREVVLARGFGVNLAGVVLAV